MHFLQVLVGALLLAGFSRAARPSERSDSSWDCSDATTYVDDCKSCNAEDGCGSCWTRLQQAGGSHVRGFFKDQNGEAVVTDVPVLCALASDRKSCIGFKEIDAVDAGRVIVCGSIDENGRQEAINEVPRDHSTDFVRATARRGQRGK